MLEEIIFSHLLFNEEYSRKVIPFLKNEYFQTRTNKILFELIDGYIKTYNVVPSKRHSTQSFSLLITSQKMTSRVAVNLSLS